MDIEVYSDPINNDTNINKVSNLLFEPLRVLALIINKVSNLLFETLRVLALIHEMDS